jgi:hypothetical protein
LYYYYYNYLLDFDANKAIKPFYTLPADDRFLHYGYETPTIMIHLWYHASMQWLPQNIVYKQVQVQGQDQSQSQGEGGHETESQSEGGQRRRTNNKWHYNEKSRGHILLNTCLSDNITHLIHSPFYHINYNNSISDNNDISLNDILLCNYGIYCGK